MKKSHSCWRTGAAWLGLTAACAALLTGCATGGGGAPSTPLEGTTWVMVSYRDPSGQMQPALADTQVTAIFEQDQVGGSDGCNRYFASYEVRGSQITIGQAGSTMMACTPEEIMRQAAEFTTALTSASRFQIEGERLKLLDAQGQEAVVFEAGAKTEGLAALAGTSWQATAINNGREAVVSVVTGSEVTATFGEDGKLSGSAGCNNYHASYSVEGKAIQIGAPAATRMMCAEPQGVMEQEAAYLAALPRAATFQASGEGLTLRDAQGAMLVQYGRVK